LIGSGSAIHPAPGITRSCGVRRRRQLLPGIATWRNMLLQRPFSATFRLTTTERAEMVPQFLTPAGPDRPLRALAQPERVAGQIGTLGEDRHCDRC